MVASNASLKKIYGKMSLGFCLSKGKPTERPRVPLKKGTSDF